MGLPAFNYGAGLNLYDLELVAYFINRLGAYKVDRRKKNPIYLDTLKTMSLEGIQSGVNTLFFPGGTRSRSGELEKSLKLGLLGTVVEAQRARLQQKEKKKIFVVPLIISYHFVLESKFLIEQHLKRTGQEQYLGSKDAAKSYKNILKFLWDLFAQGSEIYLTLGDPIDVVGNRVDESGASFDKKNREVNIEEYFTFDGNLNKSKQREGVYTKLLADKIVESYHDHNTVLSSHIVAFTLFEMISKNYPNDNVYSLVNKDPDAELVDYDKFVKRIEATQQVLVKMNSNMKINITNVIKGDPHELITTGISNMGVYHTRKPVIKTDEGQIVSEDLKLLYYYRNRLDHYDLTQKVDKLLKENKEKGSEFYSL
jgi:glycerol-3-phosphate O-acyltransferase